MHTTQFPALVHCIFLAVTVFPSRQPAKHRPAWRILVPIFMIQRCLHFVDTFEALIYYIRWYKLKKGGPTLSVDSPNIDQYKKSALLCSKALSGAPSGTLPGALLFTHLTMQRQRLRCLRKKGIHPSMNSLFALSILWNI